MFLRRRSGFSLIEMIGVLAIIAILAVIIVPKVFATISSSKITSTVGSITSIKSALTDFAGKYGTLPVIGSAVPVVSAANARIDDLLITAQNLDQRFTSKMGTQVATYTAGAAWARNAVTGAWQAPAGGAVQNLSTRITTALSDLLVPVTGNNYRLDGVTNLPVNSIVASAVIVGVPIADARELSARIDGDTLSQALGAVTADTRGKVVYAAPAGGLTDVYVYLVNQ